MATSVHNSMRVYVLVLKEGRRFLGVWATPELVRIFVDVYMDGRHEECDIVEWTVCW